MRCATDPTCRAVACQGTARASLLKQCSLSAAVQFKKRKSMSCFLRTTVPASIRSGNGEEEQPLVPLWASSAEDAQSACNVVSYGVVSQTIMEEAALGKLRNGSCNWVPLNDVGSAELDPSMQEDDETRIRISAHGLSCAEAMRDIYDDACFATVYSELLSVGQRRAVCANMAGDGGAGKSGCGFARPECDFEEL